VPNTPTAGRFNSGCSTQNGQYNADEQWGSDHDGKLAVHNESNIEGPDKHKHHQQQASTRPTASQTRIAGQHPTTSHRVRFPMDFLHDGVEM
jgi:hypothetical protein